MNARVSKEDLRVGLVRSDITSLVGDYTLKMVENLKTEGIDKCYFVNDVEQLALEMTDVLLFGGE